MLVVVPLLSVLLGRLFGQQGLNCYRHKIAKRLKTTHLTCSHLFLSKLENGVSSRGSQNNEEKTYPYYSFGGALEKNNPPLENAIYQFGQKYLAPGLG